MRDGGYPLVEWVDVGRDAEGGGVAGKGIGQRRLWFLSDFLLAMYNDRTNNPLLH